MAKSGKSGSSGRSSSGSGGGSKKSKSKRSNKSSSKSSKSSKKSRKKSIGFNLRRRPTSLASVASRNKTGKGRFAKLNTGAPGGGTAQLLNSAASVYIKYGDMLYDAVVLFIVCPAHKKFTMSTIDDRGLFLPVHPIMTNQKWMDSVKSLVRKLLPHKDGHKPGDSDLITNSALIDVLRLQLPHYFEYVTRFIYQVELTPEACKAKYCSDNDFVAWYPMGDKLAANISKQALLGPEPLMRDDFGPKPQFREVAICDVLSITMEDELLGDLGASEEDILLMYGDFLQHVYPSEYMTQDAFKSYLKKAQLKLTSDTKALFRAFGFNQQDHLNFHEFILGLATVGSLSGAAAADATEAPSKSKEVAKKKAEFLFRFFAATNADNLTKEELKKVGSVCKIHDSDLVDGHLPKSVFTKRMAKQINSPRGHEEAKSLIGIKSDVSQLARHRAHPAIYRCQVESHPQAAIEAKQAMRFLCENCRSKKYTQSLHQLRLGLDGLFYQPRLTKAKDSKRMDKAKHELSMDHFSETFVCNRIIAMLRKFAKKADIFINLPVSQDASDWTKKNTRLSSVEKIVNICGRAVHFFKNDPRVLKVSSPCYIIGDIHGNLRDLLIHEQSFWQRGIYLNTANVLFLGDYVDRGEYSVECILYLLCLKCMAPDRIHMLRGNHETREQQKATTFYAEVKEKFGQEAEKIFEAFNEVFDVMPLVAVVDEAIYCAHGGIPSCASKMEQIAAIPRQLKDPDNEDAIASEILWNDPITESQYQAMKTQDADTEAFTRSVPKGFLPNIRRSTGCYFSDQAVKNFLADNGLSHVVRAHESFPPGYLFHGGGRCTTIFSCSNYCGEINQAAVALVHDSKIRVIQVDTFVVER